MLVVAALVAGCGGSSDPLAAVRKAATRTLTLTAQSTLTLSGAQLFGDSPTVIGRGEFSFPKGLGYQAIQVPARGQQPQGTAYLVFQPGQLWIKPVSNAALPQGDLWVTTTFTHARAAVTTTPPLALVLEGTNPELLLEEIAHGAVAASSSGHPVVDHVPYSEYAVSVDLKRALAKTTKRGALRAAMQQQLTALRASSGGTRLRVVARVDGAGRLAQLEFPLAGSSLGTVQIELWKFGSAVPLSLPLAAETGAIPPVRLPVARLLTG